MDEIPSLERRPGGSVEPMSRAAVIKSQFRIPDPPPGQRFELRDPFAEVTYRANSFEDMVRKADRVGAVRFVAIAPDGKRTTVSKDGGQWHRPEPQLVKVSPSVQSETATQDVATGASKPSAEADAVRAKIDADAARAARAAQLEAALNERYLIKRTPLRIGTVGLGQTEYHYRGDAARVAFTESNLKLSTDSNNPSVARSMVDVAEARGWQSLRVSGHDDFRRLVWLEASLRGVRTLGYEPVPGDQELLRKEREARQVNRIEQVPRQSPEPTGASAEASGRGSGGRKTVLAALEAILVAKRVPEKQREAVMAAAAENLAQRIRNGETHRIKVYDKDAPSHRPAPAPAREPQRARERTPAR